VKLRIDVHLPPRGPARLAAIAMLVVGGAVAVALPVLILLFALSSLR
jgi:hypothetical protein